MSLDVSTNNSVDGPFQATIQGDTLFFEATENNASLKVKVKT